VVEQAPTALSPGGAPERTIQRTNRAAAGPSSDPAVCPYFHEAVELLGKRWTGAIVHVLLAGPMRFSELTHTVPQISDRLLSMRLKELETFGIVVRQVYEHPPVRVEYELSAKGRALEPTVTALRTWARDWLQD
jgi:DNA-binding HxlR family transcriptional regulator